MQTILGAGGAIGTELAKVLPEYTDEIRLVSRNPQNVNANDKLVQADLSDREQVFYAVKDSEVAYLTVGLPYRLKVWESTWPVIMKNVLEACKEYNTKLVFFDNIYMYDPKHLEHMTEKTPIDPSSKKGKVRAELVHMIFERIENKDIQAVIARSADFYGPSIEDTSILTETVFNKLAEDKKADWLGSDNFKHSFTYTPDAAKATALLGNTPDAYNQVWHLPTASNPPTGKEWIEMIANEMGAEPKYRTVSKFTVRMMGLFSPVMREMVEMMYQNDRHYVFDSSKFEERFHFSPTPYKEGIRYIVNQDYRKTEV